MAIDAGATYAHLTGNGGGGHSRRHQRFNSGGVDAGFATTINTLGLGAFDAVALAVAANVGLELGLSQIGPYLTEGPTLYVEKRSEPLSDIPVMLWGNKPTDNGNLILSSVERTQILDNYPGAQKFVRRFMGSYECINGIERYCLWVTDDQRGEAEKIAELKRRFEAVAEFRAASVAAQTRPAAAYPHRFRQIQATAISSAIVVPSVSSERRRYLPVDFISDNAIISNLAFAIYDAPLWTLSIISSRMHLLWIETVCGKLKSDFRYSNTMGWNTFPMPSLSLADRDRLTTCSENILLTRAEAGGTLAELYDPGKMPDALQQAHEANDQTLERIYSDRPFRSDADRLNHLFRRYARMIAAERGEEVAPEFDLDGEEQVA